MTQRQVAERFHSENAPYTLRNTEPVPPLFYRFLLVICQRRETTTQMFLIANIGSHDCEENKSKKEKEGIQKEFL
jgi:hypothetical protein